MRNEKSIEKKHVRVKQQRIKLLKLRTFEMTKGKIIFYVDNTI